MSNSYAFLERIWAETRSWLRAVSRRRRLESEMEAELLLHLESLEADLVRAGYSRAEAARRARIELGSAVVHKDSMRASLGLGWWDGLLADLRYGLRTLRRSLGFTSMAVLSLGLAIGATATIFSVAKQLLYERLPVPHAAELRLLAWTANDKRGAVHSIWGDYAVLPDGRATSTAFSYPVFQQLRKENRGLQDLFAYCLLGGNATIHGSARQVMGAMVSGNYYADLQVQPILGRGITPEDDAKPGQGAVVVISYGLWEREFGKSPSVLGQVIRVNGIPLTVVGVNPREFTSANDVQTAGDVFVPLSMQPVIRPMPGLVQPLFDQELWWVVVMGRTNPGVSDATAQAGLDAQLAAAVYATMPVKKDEEVPRIDLRDGSRGLFTQERAFAKPMAVLMTLVALVLLLACANIANLMLARGTQRQREVSVRLALGAGRARILRQMLVESLTLAAMGGALGLVIAYFGRNALPRMIENSWEPVRIHVHFDWGVFGFTSAVTMLTGILFGLAPALAAARYDVNHGLKESTKTTSRRRKGLGGGALVGLQIALSTLLVIGAGLFLRTLAGLSAVNVGFRTDHLLLLEVDPSRTQYPPGKDVALHERLEAAFAAVPGVEAVSPSGIVYISHSGMQRGFVPEGKDPNLPDQSEHYNVIGNNFFPTMGIRMAAGRGFGSQDTATSVKVGVINESLAHNSFPNQNPIGRRFSISTEASDGYKGRVMIQIVGVCTDTRYSSLRDEAPPQFFLPYVQRSEIGGMSYAIRTTLPLEAVIPSLRHVAQQIDPDLPLGYVRTQDQQIQAAMQQERVFVTLSSGFGLLALALASVGVYGIMAYSVAQRTNEIGIRLALGAQPRQVLGMILREATWISLGGVTCGLVAALVLARLVRSMLYGLQPSDPVSLLAGAALLIAVGLAASWLPARRAAGVQPMDALRHE